MTFCSLLISKMIKRIGKHKWRSSFKYAHYTNNTFKSHCIVVAFDFILNENGIRYFSIEINDMGKVILFKLNGVDDTRYFNLTEPSFINDVVKFIRQHMKETSALDKPVDHPITTVNRGTSP